MPSEATNNAHLSPFYRFNRISGAWEMTDGLGLNVLNRGFLYGDGTFNTFMVLKGDVQFERQHREKIAIACSKLELALNDHVLTAAFALAKGFEQTVWRLYVIASGAVGYGSRDGGTEYWLSCSSYSVPVLKQSKVGLYDRPIYAGSIEHQVKTLSAMPYVLAARFAADAGWDDALLVNTHQQVASLTSSCVAYGLNGNACVIPLDDGTHPGAGRATILEKTKAWERSLAVSELKRLEWMVGLNAVRPTLVSHIAEQKIDSPPERILALLAAMYPALGDQLTAQTI